MRKKSRREFILASPRVRGEAGFYAKRKIRVRGSLRIRFVCNPGEGPPRSLELQNLRKQPLTPTLSPQVRGEGAR